MHDIISVIVPIYCVEKYINQCIDSILNQSYPYLEIILVDDGSPDNCGLICDEYAKKDGRIKVIHKKNGGLSDARNAGIKISSGKYIAFVDSDDCIDQRMYEKLQNTLQECGADIAECHSVSFDDGSIPNARYSNQIKELTAKEWITETSLGDFLSCVAWNKLYKKELFIGIEYPVGRHYEDDATTYKLVYRANKIVRLTDALYFYRQRQNSITAQKNIREIKQQFQALYEKCLFFNSLNENELEVFSYSRLIIFLLSNLEFWEGVNSFESKKWKSIIKQNKRGVYFSKSVPFKYKLYIAIKTLFFR